MKKPYQKEGRPTFIGEQFGSKIFVNMIQSILYFMKNTLILLALVFLASQCSTLEFEQALPTGGETVKTLPRSLIGTYQDTADSVEILKHYHQIAFLSKEHAWNYYIQPYLMDTDLYSTKEAFIRNDSLFNNETNSSSPKFITQVNRVGDRYVAPNRLRYRVEPAKGMITLYDEETGAPTPYQLILRKKGNVYYFNMKDSNAQYWQTTALQQTAVGIRFDYLSDPKGATQELPFSTRMVIHDNGEGNADTTMVARPTDAELDKYMHTQAFLKTEYLLKIKK